MPYRFAQERPDYADFAAGPVLYSLPGRPAFPVRLTTEIFQRCQARLLQLGKLPPYTLYDPCCGSAYLLVTAAYLHWPVISGVVGSDVDPGVMPLAKRNLSLLTRGGVDARIAQLAQLHQEFGKPSHAEALEHAQQLRERLQAYDQLHQIRSEVFVANALSGTELQQHLEPGTADIIMTDLPYGQRTAWHDPTPEAFGPEWQLLEALRAVVGPASIVALTTTKQQKVGHDAYQRIEQFQIGKRHTRFFMLLNPRTK